MAGMAGAAVVAAGCQLAGGSPLGRYITITGIGLTLV
jgi:hypothetical protein